MPVVRATTASEGPRSLTIEAVSKTSARLQAQAWAAEHTDWRSVEYVVYDPADALAFVYGPAAAVDLEARVRLFEVEVRPA